MVDKITRSPMSDVQTTLFFNLVKGPNPSYLKLQFGNILPIINWDIVRKNSHLLDHVNHKCEETP